MDNDRKSDYLREGEDGFMLVELLIVLALLGIVIGLIYQYFNYGWGSFSRAEAASNAQMQARNTVSQMDNEVRNGIIANDSDSKSVMVSSDQRQLTIYSYVSYQKNDIYPEKITYQLQPYPVNSPKYFRLLKYIQPVKITQPPQSKYPYSYATLPAPPNDDSPDNNINKLNCWMTVIKRVDNDSIFNPKPDTIFQSPYTMDNIIVQVDIQANDWQHPLPKPVEVKSILTVRSQGVKAN